MSMQLYLKYGSTTIDFQENGFVLVDGFYPTVATNLEEHVTDRFDVWYQANSATALTAAIRSINQAFAHARAHQSDVDGCWMYFSIDDESVAWRTRVYDGVMLHNANVARRWDQGKFLIGISFERAPFWEGAETDVILSNPNGSGVNGVTVYNCNDNSGSAPNKRVNYVDIAADQVEGDLPAPAIMKITNNDNITPTQLFNVWIGQNFTDPVNAAWTFEAEAAIGAVPIASASYSGGYKVSVPVNNSSMTELSTWAITAAQMSAFRGQFVHAIFRFGADVRNIKFLLQIKWNDFVIWESDPIVPSGTRVGATRDLFSLRMPPWLQNENNLDSIKIVLSGQHLLLTSYSVDMDFMMLISADGFRYLRCIADPAYGTAYGSRIIDDGISGEYFQDNGNGINKVGIISGYGNPIQLMPNKSQRLYFLMHSYVIVQPEVNRTLSIKISYRPRRLGL